MKPRPDVTTEAVPAPHLPLWPAAAASSVTLLIGLLLGLFA